MFRKIVVACALLLATPAFAQQGQPVKQSGPSVTSGHVPYWVTSGVIGDGGSATDSPVTSLGVTNNGSAGLCVSSGRQNAAGRNQLCFGAQTAGPATISLQNYGTATAQALQFVVNGVTQGFPTVANLPVVVNDYVCFSTTTGSLKDCGWAQSIGLANQIPVWTSSAAIGNIMAVNNSVLLTNGSSVPAWSPGVAGTVLAGNSPAFTATPTLGASGTIGTIAFGNATSGTVTLGTVAGALGTVTASLPANTGTIAETNLAQTWSAAQSFTSSDLLLLGSGSGQTTVNAPATGGGVATFFTGTDTILGAASTATLTNKTFPSSTNSFAGTLTNDNAAAGNIGEYIVANCPNQTTATVTITIAAPGVVTWTGHPFLNSAIEKDACPVTFTTTGALPTGLTSGTTVYVVPSSITANTFQVATNVANALAGTSITTTGTQSGTQTGTASVTLAGNATAANLTGLSLTAGDWDVSFAPQFVMTNANTAWTTLLASTSTTTATTDSSTGDRYMSTNQASTAPGINAIQSLKIPVARFSLSITTTVFGVVNQAFTGAGATMIGWGTLRARRVR